MDETLSITSPAPDRGLPSRRTRAITTVAMTAAIFVSSVLGQARSTAPLAFAENLPQSTSAGSAIALDDLGNFVIGDLNAYWARSFASAGVAYSPTTIVYFEVGLTTGCGYEPAAVGPFYCPTDHTVYMPNEFFVGDTRTQDFAVATIIAHEVGHHVQNLMGITDAATAGTITSIQQELQADCLAGVWSADFESRGWLTAGDYGEALASFQAIGDDTLGVPEARWTHGSSAQRVGWYEYGHSTADGGLCVTY